MSTPGKILELFSTNSFFQFNLLVLWGWVNRVLSIAASRGHCWVKHKTECCGEEDGIIVGINVGLRTGGVA